jgi:hypothetical protein
MKMKTVIALTSLLVLLAGNIIAAPMGTAFTYQGQLYTGGNPANGRYDLTFTLFDSSGGTGVIAGPITNTAVAVSNGHFTVTLNFGGAAFNGEERWLQIAARTNGVGSYTNLSPRQLVPLMPNALYAASAGSVQACNLIGTVADASLSANVALLNGSQTFSGNPLFTGNLTLKQGLSGTALWDINVANYHDPSGGPYFTNALAFSKHGGVVMILDPSFGIGTTGNVGANGNLQCGGNIDVGYNITAGRNIIASGFIGSQNNLDVQGDIDCGGNIDANGNVTASAFLLRSDRKLKERFAPIGVREILNRVASLPISTWNFKTDTAVRHIGPMAQDFYATFNVGADDKHIATVDADGVALAAIQGLNQKLEEQLQAKDGELQALKQRLEKLEQLIAGQNR